MFNAFEYRNVRADAVRIGGRFCAKSRRPRGMPELDPIGPQGGSVPILCEAFEAGGQLRPIRQPQLWK